MVICKLILWNVADGLHEVSGDGRKGFSMILPETKDILCTSKKCQFHNIAFVAWKVLNVYFIITITY
jgi:hypothetical protein